MVRFLCIVRALLSLSLYTFNSVNNWSFRNCLHYWILFPFQVMSPNPFHFLHLELIYLLFTRPQALRPNTSLNKLCKKNVPQNLNANFSRVNPLPQIKNLIYPSPPPSTVIELACNSHPCPTSRVSV